MASAAEDGAVLFWNTSNGKLLATLSIMGSEKGKRDYDRAYVSTQQWIAFTPNGFYDAAPQMKQWIRWRSGDELSTALAYESTLHRPEKLRQLLYMH
jgi:frataxin-like iron-binding protein CyaY